MNELQQHGSMAQANSYAQQGAHDFQQRQQSYGQQGENPMQKQGQGFAQGQNFNQGVNNPTGGAQEQMYNGGTQQQPAMINSNQGQSYGQSAQEQSHMMTGSQEQSYGQGQNTYQSGNNMTGSNQAQNYNQGAQEQSHMMNGSQGQQPGSTTGMNGQAGQVGAQYPDSKAPDTMHKWLDRIEKKFGGERFDEAKHPENAAKNKALNESIIKKFTQVMKIVMQRGPRMAMQYGSKLF